MKVGSPTGRSDRPGASWRHAMFERVSATSPRPVQVGETPKKTKEELRELWRRAIERAILLVRMEKENAKLRARQEETAVKRIKLEYDELTEHGAEQHEFWEQLMPSSGLTVGKMPPPLQAVGGGVPRARRGDVWRKIAEWRERGRPPSAISQNPQYETSYERLLTQLTSHQHAILIDLGRTFPNHPYFSSPLGPGQLALFNLLKAYSLLDPEVGYCQGLSFVAGVLLLHVSILLVLINK